MKKTTFFYLLLIFNSANSQISINNYSKLSNTDYKLYFPVETQIALFCPTTDYVCILPTHEEDTVLQKEINEFYKRQLIDRFPTIPGQVKRIITDIEALNEVLSDVNIHAFGTIDGNLWISDFMRKNQEFPVKITKDSITAEKSYIGSDYSVTALWYNPFNPKHSLTLYIPQNLNTAKSFKRQNTLQYAIFKNGEIVKNAYYIFRDNHWNFYERLDTMLVFRDVNHLIPNNYETIADFYCRYPTLKQLKTCHIDENDIAIDTIKIMEPYDLNNISDMNWLQPIAQKYKTICIGELHHLKYNKPIFERILFSLNKFDYYPQLILELPYSYSAYINFYVSIQNDEEAKSYSDTLLSKIDNVDMPMFEIIRKWNKENPKKKIQIGCSDIEHNFVKTIKLILNPYLSKIDPNANLNYSVEDSLRDYLFRAKRIISEAKENNLVGNFPFETATYMESVLKNLESSISIKLDPKKFYDHTDRFKVMIRNVTDDLFLGNQVANSKCVFYGGEEHFRIFNDGSIINAKKTEGYYLAHYFKPTEDSVYSIAMRTLAVSINDSIQKIDPALNFFTEVQLINLFTKKLIKLNEPVINPYLSEFENYFYKLSYKYPGYAIRINNIDFNSVLNKYQGFIRYSLYMSLKNSQDFSANIIIPYSPIGD
ncbi:MAG: hypothetical protein JXB00_19545 [Bacteroidales bacterium]|nr:hypothetical protein [Bacteroidales bacterium]